MNKVALFVDYENLFYSMHNKFQCQPDPMELVNIALQYGQLVVAKAYGDFEKNIYIKAEVPKVRASSLEIVHTRTEIIGGKEKSFTDFKILEDLFVFKEENKDVNTVILATGDGHFSNIVARMKIRDGKKVVVVAVKGSLSRELQMAAGKEDSLEINGISYEVDLEDLNRFILNQEEKYQYLTFIRTTQAYLDSLDVPLERKDFYQKKIITALNQLIVGGKIEQIKINRNNVPVNIIRSRRIMAQPV